MTRVHLRAALAITGDQAHEHGSTGPEPAEPFPTPSESPNPPEVPPSPSPIEDPVTEPDVTDPGVGMPVPGPESDIHNVPSGPMVA